MQESDKSDLSTQAEVQHSKRSESQASEAHDSTNVQAFPPLPECHCPYFSEADISSLERKALNRLLAVQQDYFTQAGQLQQTAKQKLVSTSNEKNLVAKGACGRVVSILPQTG